MVKLNDGHVMPVVGFGTYQMPKRLTQRCAEEAFELGYRHIDTAQCYGNEREVGLALKASGLRREDVFVTTKLWGGRSYGDTMRLIEGSLRELELDYIDLFLIHEPSGDFVTQYQAMEDCQQAGLLRSIGVSNFLEGNYRRLLSACKVIPAVDQIETHVYRQQGSMHRILAEYGTIHEAWSPLACGQNGFFSDPVLSGIGKVHGKSNAQVGLRFLRQQGMVVIPKSTHRERMRENLAIDDFELSADEMRQIRSLDTGRSQFDWW